jgi:MFS family permease
MRRSRIALAARTRLPSLSGITRWLRVKQLSVEDRNILYFTLDTALQGLMMGGIFSFLSVFVVRLGASKLMTSLLTSLPAIVVMVASIPAGQYIQRRRNLIRLTTWIRVFHRGTILLVALLPFFVSERLVEVIVAVWTIKAISNALLESSWMAVVAEVIPPARRATVNGTRWAVLSLVTALSVAIFGYVLDRIAFPLNYQIVFLASFAGGVAGMGLFARMQIPDNVPVERKPQERVPLAQRVQGYLQTLNSPDFVRYELTTLVLRFGLNMPTALYSIYWIRQLDASDLWIGWQATVGKLVPIAGYYLWGKIVNRKGHHVPLLICTVGVGLYPVLMGFVNNQVWLPVVAVVQGFFLTGINLAFFDTLLSVCPAERRPTYFAVNTLLMSLAMFLAPIVGSLLADWMDIRTVFFIVGGIHFVAALLFWRYRIAAD